MVFLHYRNLFTLGIAHAILGVCVAISVPATVQHNMRVGLGYLKYRPHGRHHLNQMDHKVSTVAWVTADAPDAPVLTPKPCRRRLLRSQRAERSAN